MTHSPGAHIHLPTALIQRWTNQHGQDAVSAWLDRYPALLARLCDEWEIEIQQEMPPISYNIVLFGVSRRVGEVVLKLSLPGIEVDAEIAALSLTAGRGSATLHAADSSVAYMVQSRIRPGTMLYDDHLPDDEATRIGAQAMLNWWRVPETSDRLIPLERWARDLTAYDPALHPEAPNDLILRAQEIAGRLLANPRRVGLLHGDVHHQNILRERDHGWVLIDPKGLVGELGYEVGTWMMNTWGFPGRSEFHDLANRRLDILAEMLGEDRRRLAEWSVVHATLSLCWALSDDEPEDLANDILYAECMARLLD